MPASARHHRQSRRRHHHQSAHRRWRCPGAVSLGLVIVFAAPLAVAVTTITLEGAIDVVDMSADPNLLNIEQNDPFEVVVTYDETLVMATGTLFLGDPLGQDPNSTFALTIEDQTTSAPSLQQTQADDLFGAPALTLDNGNFSALQFSSNPFPFVAPNVDGYTNLVAASPPDDPPDGALEILDLGNQQLVRGSFSGIAVSPE